MATEEIRRMIRGYQEQIEPPMFLTSLAQAPRENYHNAQEVEYDVMRTDEDVAVPMVNSGVGYNMIQAGGYTNKKVAPPVFKEAIAIDADSLVKEKQFSETIYQDPNFIAAATKRALTAARHMTAKINRALELQMSQILTTGEIASINSANETVFAVDFFPKTTHFANAAVKWETTASATPIVDLLNMCNVIRTDGKRDPVRVIMGDGSFENAMKITSWKERFFSEQAKLGQITPMRNPGTGGGVYRGYVEVGSYRLDVWTYAARYDSPYLGTSTKYVPDDKVIIESGGRIDATFGRINNFGTDGRALRFMPGRIGRSSRLSDMTFNNWISPDGETLKIGVGSRPLIIPTAIDTFGCIDTDF